MSTAAVTLAGASHHHQQARQRTFWQDARRAALRNPFALVGALVVVAFVVAALIGPALTPYDYAEQDLLNVESPPSRLHWLGTDELGRDLLSRLLYGARTAFLVASMVTLVGGVIGVGLGAVAAVSERIVGGLVMRLIDVLLSFPHLLLAVFANATLRPTVQRWFLALHGVTGWEIWRSRLLSDYLVVFGVLALVSWPGLARLVRGQMLSLKHAEFVEAARVAGATPGWIVGRHLVPNVIGPVIVTLTVGFGSAMLLESALSYLGIGIQPPAASWGAMISENQAMWRYTPHLVLVPGGALAIVIFAFNFFGDGLNDALNPKSRRR